MGARSSTPENTSFRNEYNRLYGRRRVPTRDKLAGFIDDHEILIKNAFNEDPVMLARTLVGNPPNISDADAIKEAVCFLLRDTEDPVTLRGRIDAGNTADIVNRLFNNGDVLYQLAANLLRVTLVNPSPGWSEGPSMVRA
jgi:hypothetical protein